MEKCSLNRYAIILLLLPFLLGGAPSRTKTYTTGEVISASDVTENEDNLFRYVQTGVDTYADSTIVSADITDGTIVSADISDGTIVSADISDGTIVTADISDGTIVNADINSSAAIDASKIADGTVSSTEFQYINSLSSNAQTQIANILSGTTPFSGLTASANLDIGTYELRANTLQSDVATGTAPLIVASTTKVTNLNADTVDGIDSTNLGLSNVIYCWIGSDNASTNIFGLKQGTSLNPDMTVYTVNYLFFGVDLSTYRTILTGRFVKIAGISTVTIHARTWIETAGTQTASVKVDIGGQNNTVSSTIATPAWVTTSTIDVSGLTNGTTYDITIQLAEISAGGAAYCSGVILTGS